MPAGILNPLPAVAPAIETRVPVVLVVGGAGVGKTAVAAAVMHDAVVYRHLRVLVLVPSVHSFREALERASGPLASDPLPLGCDVVQVAEEVSGGCVCCTVRRDIEDVLADEALAGSPSFDLVVIDTAATSDPMPVIATLFEEHANEVVTPEVSQSFHLDSVVCVVDGRQMDCLGRNVHEARQLAFADVIVVTHAQHRAAGGAEAALPRRMVEEARALAKQQPGAAKAEPLVLPGMPKSVTLTLSHEPSDDNSSLSAATSATSKTPLLPELARERICAINPLVQIKELPRVIPGHDADSAAAKALPGHVPFAGGGVVRMLTGFNTYCASAFDRLDLSGLRTPLRLAPSLSPSGVVTAVVYAEGRLMQRRFRDCMSALLRLCKENIFRMRGELCYAETEDARWLFHAVHSVVTISESEGRPWGPTEPRVNLLIVTGHDLPISELHACLRMSLIEEAEKSADAMAQVCAEWGRSRVVWVRE